MPMVKVTVFKCPNCRQMIPNGLNRDDYGIVTCPSCSRPVKITDNEYKDIRSEKIMRVCWASAAVALFVIITIASLDKRGFGYAVMLGVIGSAICTYMAGGLLGEAIIKLFPREFRTK